MLSHDSFQMQIELNPDEKDAAYISHQLYLENVKNGMPTRTTCWMFTRNEEGQVVGGCMFYLFDFFIYIDKLWVDDNYRGQGLGKKMVMAIEAEAKKKGCKTAHLDTFSFQNAKAFYEHCGYRVVSENEAIAGRHIQYFMKKVL